MPQFTAATARENALRAHQARAAKKLALAQAAQTQVVRVLETANYPQKPADPYIGARLKRVRLQIHKLEDMLEVELEPTKIDKLASAIARLSEIERNLANRPAPGSLRPTEKPVQGRASWLLGPTDQTPIEYDSKAGRVEQE